VEKAAQASSWGGKERLALEGGGRGLERKHRREGRKTFFAIQNRILKKREGGNACRTEKKKTGGLRGKVKKFLEIVAS